MNSINKSGVNPCDKCHFSAAERGKFVRHVKGVTRMKFNLVINVTYPFEKCYLSFVLYIKELISSTLYCVL